MHQPVDELTNLKVYRRRLFRCCEALLKISSRHHRVLSARKTKRKVAEKEIGTVYDELLDMYMELK